MKGKSILVFGLSVLALSACSSSSDKHPRNQQVFQVAVGSEPAVAPSGVVRYCWEEPMVQREHINAGLDQEGKWYNPSHVQVRQVRGGKWRPCRVSKVN